MKIAKIVLFTTLKAALPYLPVVGLAISTFYTVCDTIKKVRETWNVYK